MAFSGFLNSLSAFIAETSVVTLFGSRVVSWWRVEVGCLQEIIYINLKLSIVYYYNTCTGRI